ncbi:MAG: Fe-S cluster assembly protein SufD [Bacteroidales bacterium]|nr:Fe-S cluster assembly protein SufD [Bacteroidales bacterium]
MMKVKTENFGQNIIRFFEQNQKAMTEFSTDFISEKRKQAFSKFKENPVVPNKKLEDYQNTDLTKAFSADYFYHTALPNLMVKKEDLFTCDVPQLDTYSALLINGWYLNHEEEKLIELPSGVIYGSFLEAAKKYPEIIENYCNKHEQTEPLAIINQLFSQDGFFVFVPDNVILDKPLQLINLVSAHEPVMLFPRSLFVIGKNAQAKIILCEHSIFPDRFLNNSLLEVFTEDHAHFEFVRMQNAHNQSVQLTTTHFNQHESSTVVNNTITLHGGLVRNNICGNLNANGCNHEMYGLFLVDKGQHVDNFTFIDHTKPHSDSVELFKGILDDNATGVFAGRILVEKDAQQTNAFQTNKNILLTDEAKMNTRPQLEIYADDVKCSHGATVGQIDEDALFYLRSRGIYKKDARLMLIHAFAHEIISKISILPLREELDSLVNKRLRGDLARCNKCKIKC